MSGLNTNAKRLRGITILALLLVVVVAVSFFCNSTNESLSFIVAQDWRYKTTEKYQKPEYFLGALQAIERVGKGAFMLSPGDVSPMDVSRELIAQVLGADYPWYPVAGNHELDDSSYIGYLRKYNRNGNSLPHVVRKGPPGCEETTYAFEIGDCHIAVINVYFDGKSDHGTDGDIVPELLEWLEEDLRNTDKPYVFVAGHEPMLAQPDMDNGRIRHQGDSLDKYHRNAFRLRELLKKYNVNAFFNGHTHGASICKINGVWQVDSGHAYGIEDPYPEYMFQEISEDIASQAGSGKSVETLIVEYFSREAYSIKKVLYYTELTEGISYKKYPDKPALQQLIRFYKDYKNNPEMRQKYIDTFNKNWDLARSTFLKVTLQKPVKVEVYRDDARGGEYTLMHTVYLN